MASKHRNIFIIGGIAAVLMFAFCFAMVPFYNLLCKTTGMNTSASGNMLITPAAAEAIQQSPGVSREITVQFVTTNNMGMPWDFSPNVKSIRVKTGEKNTVYFYAKNTTAKLMTAQALPSMTPSEALGHFHKIECFCFRQQTLKAGESKNMPLVFQIDKDLPKDLHVITLSYTLFDATPKEETRKG